LTCFEPCTTAAPPSKYFRFQHSLNPEEKALIRLPVGKFLSVVKAKGTAGTTGFESSAPKIPLPVVWEVVVDASHGAPVLLNEVRIEIPDLSQPVVYLDEDVSRAILASMYADQSQH
jgi:hypothetical protein